MADPAGRRRDVAWVVAIAALVSIFVARVVFRAWPGLERYDADFGNFFAAARALRQGGSPFAVPGHDYPPLFAVLLLPLTGLGYETARQAWLVVLALALVAAALVLVRILGGDRRAALVVAALWAASGTIEENLVLGQPNPLLLLLVVLALDGLRRRRGTEGAPAAAVAAALKIWPGILLLAYALGRRRRALLAGVATGALVVAASWAAVAVGPPPHRPTVAAYWAGTPAPLSFSLPSTALRLADPPEGRGPLPAAWLHGNDASALELSRGHRLLSIGVSLAVLALGFGILAWATPREASGEDLALVAAALVALALAAAPISWYHYQLLQLPGLALLAVRRLRRSPLREAWPRLLALAGLLVGLGWTQVLLVGPYVERWGWTAASPVWLWTATSVVGALSLVVFGLLVGELAATADRPRLLQEK